MADLYIYQIGLGSFGQYGFEKFLGMEENLEEADIVLKGVCDEDRDRLGNALDFASSNGKDLKGFTEVERMYEEASKEDGKVLIYDAGPTEFHSDNIVRSLRHGFYHLAEKPPSLTREDYLEEKQMMEKRDIFWKVDFIERQNPVVRKSLDLLEGEMIENIKVFRESSVGIQKLVNPVERSGVLGGDILDKMFHEIFVLDFLKKADEETDLKLLESSSDYLMPYRVHSDSLMNIYGSKSDSISSETATAMSSAHIESGSVDIKLHSSWLGVSDKSRTLGKMFESLIEHNPIVSDVKKEQDQAFVDEEARFFVLEGSIDLLGDMLNKRLFNLDSGEEIDIDNFIQDQLYLVLEKAILDAVEERNLNVEMEETSSFSDMIFDIKDDCLENAGDYHGELERSNSRVEDYLVEEELESVKN